MGTTYNNKTLIPAELLRLPSPVLLCVDRADYRKAIEEAGYQTISLNLPLARSLNGLAASDIHSVVGDKIREVLPTLSSIYLTNYEMLFDTSYGLDVIRLFIDISRQNKLIVRWCGTVNTYTLTYAEQGYEDYTRINISDYDITVVI